MAGLLTPPGAGPGRPAGFGARFTRMEGEMGISTAPVLMELAEQREAERVEAEAWKIAQLAATLAAPLAAAGKAFEWVDLVKTARALLAESRRQAAAPAGERDDG